MLVKLRRQGSVNVGDSPAVCGNRFAELQRVQPGMALAPLAPDPVATGLPVREIDRIDGKQKIG